MQEILEEYGSSILGVLGGVTVIGILTKLLFSGGILGELLLLLGSMAC